MKNMHLSLTVLAVYTAWKWGDWRNWRKYHATMLYMTSMSLLYFFYCSGHLLWRIVPDFRIPYAVTESLYFFIIYPATVLLYLTEYPVGLSKKVLYNLKWIGIYIGFEFLANLFNKITYFNKWNLLYSLLFVCVMFPMLRLHYLKPLVAYLVSLVIIAVLLMYFNVPIKLTSRGLSIWI
ncbi:CBO0543 family protein [Alkalihalobacillus sp. TS-13]|uniref:CBO0543 family protein n=1 Tax=Alkalihalobacillus sp. TS-13 TaxID=2842455 RepID=UPI001C88135B|nr:CBO0543 family protein [Alkalihalobacillus sp. TS-13]